MVELPNCSDDTRYIDTLDIAETCVVSIRPARQYRKLFL